MQSTSVTGFALLVFLSLLSGPSIAQSKKELAVLKLSNKKFDWLINKQTDSLEIVLDDGVQYIHSNGLIQSKQDVIDDLQSGKLVYKHVVVKDAHVRWYASTAIITGTGRFAGIVNGSHFEVDLLYTEVYVFKNKKWQLASRHANKLP